MHCDSSASPPPHSVKRPQILLRETHLLVVSRPPDVARHATSEARSPAIYLHKRLFAFAAVASHCTVSGPSWKDITASFTISSISLPDIKKPRCPSPGLLHVNQGDYRGRCVPGVSPPHFGANIGAKLRSMPRITAFVLLLAAGLNPLNCTKKIDGNTSFREATKGFQKELTKDQRKSAIEQLQTETAGKP